jgi:hypothetical protein
VFVRNTESMSVHLQLTHTTRFMLFHGPVFDILLLQRPPAILSGYIDVIVQSMYRFLAYFPNVGL